MGRVPYWNISYGIVIDLLAAPVFAIFLYGLYGHWKHIKQGKAEIVLGSRLRSSALKIGPVYLGVLLQKGILGSRIYKKLFTGIAHGLLFWGMGLLLLGTIAVFLDVLFDVPVFRGVFNRWFMSFVLDAAGLAAFAGVLFLLIRRLMFPPERLFVPKPRPGFVFMEVVIGVIILTGFLLEALRISHNGFEEGAFV